MIISKGLPFIQVTSNTLSIRLVSNSVSVRRSS